MKEYTVEYGLKDFIEAISFDIAHSAMTDTFPSMQSMHQNLYAEYAEEIVKLTLYISSFLNKNKEHIAIKNGIYIFTWPLEKFCIEVPVIVGKLLLNKYSERWEKKSKVAGTKQHPAKAGTVNIPLEKKEDNHFIPKSFLKKYWADKASGYIRKCNIHDGDIVYKDVPFGSWGYRKNFYSPYREELFSKIESSASTPIEKILNMRGVNLLEQEAMLWFVVMQLTRSPKFIDNFYKDIRNIIVEHGGVESPEVEILQQFYDLLMGNHTLYTNLSAMLMGNIWCVLNSEQSKFILPDTAGLIGTSQGRTYVIFPITPHACFFILPIEDKYNMRVHVQSVVADDDISEIVYDALACDVENEFVGDIQRDDYIICRKFSYSSLDKVFSFIENKLEEIKL